MNNNWDLSLIFKSDDLWEKEYEKYLKEIEKIKNYKGKITESLEAFKNFTSLKETLSQNVVKIYMYAHLNHDVDTRVSKYKEYYIKAEKLYNLFNEYGSYIENEEQENQEKILEYLKDAELSYLKHYYEEMFKQKEHLLSEKEEEILAKLNGIMQAPHNVFTALDDTDISFDDVDGEKLNGENYIVFLESKDRQKREKAYKNLYSKYTEFGNTYAQTLSSNVMVQNTCAKIRKYESARAASIKKNSIDPKVYDKLVGIVNNNLGRLHDYLSFRKQVLGLEKLNMYDIYVSLAKEKEFSFTIEEAKEIMFEALKPLGEEYLSIVKKCFDERWIDFVPNDGKRGGAYSSGGFDVRPYILMTFNGNMGSVYTLAHEIGHSIHTYYSSQNPYIYSSYTMFLAEIASTTNENLLTQYFLDKYKDDKEALIYILNEYLDGFRGTVYRQTQFAEFEDKIHVLESENTSLTKEKLNEVYADINSKYYGKDVITDEYISIEWARIPHFYYNFYVYQYATGFCIATYFAKSIKEGRENAVEKYINYLKSGSSKNTLEILKEAGVDVLNTNVLEDAFEEFSEKLELLKEVYNK